jgi:hypothetical protein
MQKELAIGWLFVRAIFEDWVGRMSGGLGLLLTIGAFFISNFASPMLFVTLGVLALLFACYRAWRKEYGDVQQLARIVHEGEKCLEAFSSHTAGQPLAPVLLNLQSWHNETLASLQAPPYGDFRDGTYTVDSSRQRIHIGLCQINPENLRNTLDSSEADAIIKGVE